MPVNELGKVTGGGTPAGRKLKDSLPGEVRTRKATPEELAELEARIREKKGRAGRQLPVSPIFPKSGIPEKDRETAKRLRDACRNLSRDRWERMRALVVVAGAANGWEVSRECREEGPMGM